MSETETGKVTRFEVINHTSTGAGRDYIRYGVAVRLDLQDDGRTLKVFLTDSEIATSGEVQEEITQKLGEWARHGSSNTDDCGVCTRYADGTVLIRSECPQHGTEVHDYPQSSTADRQW